MDESIEVEEETKLYSTVLLDPPWYQRGGGKCKRGADRHYSLMKEHEIRAIVASVLSDKLSKNAHMYMWVANNHLPEAIRIIESLGFRYITNVVWAKTKIGLGRYFRGQHEICLFAVRGNGMINSKDCRTLSSLLGQSMIRPTQHSAKPLEMYDLIEARSKGPYLELFARHKRPGWDVWGHEAPE